MDDLPELEDFSAELKEIKKRKENLAPTSTKIKVSQESKSVRVKEEKPKETKVPVKTGKPKKGFKKGFLLRNSEKVSDTVEKPEIKAKPQEERFVFDEVQKEMNKNLLGNIMSKKEEWANQDLMEKIKSRPDLLKYFMDPQFAEAIGLMQQNPKEAMKLYGDRPEFKYFMTEFSKLMGSHFGEIAQKQEDNTPLQDPEVQELLKDPEVAQVVQRCQMQGRLDFHQINPTVAMKVKKLIDKGVFNVERS